jgi:hypothetical protein
MYARLGLGDFGVAQMAVEEHLATLGAYQRNFHVDDNQWTQLVSLKWNQYAQNF